MPPMVLSVILGLLLFSSSSNGRYFENFGQDLPELAMDAAEIVKHHGYSFEEHWVTTKDGYILNILRIPPTDDPTKVKRPVALFTHGLMESCAVYFLGEKDSNLPYVLADKGVDVWLGNNRGTRYSQNHTTLSPKSYEYWDFSLDEMIDYDLEAMINYVTEKTKSEKIYYVGRSQGSALGFAKFGEDEDLASKVKHFLAIGPIAKVENTKTFLRYLTPYARSIKFSSAVTRHGKFELPKRIQQLAAKYGCQGIGYFFCKNAFFAMVGADEKHLDSTRLAVLQAHIPDSTSVHVMLQWAQNVKAGKFQRYDFGSKASNRRHYGRDTPPPYHPNKVSIPVALIRGERDIVCDEKDVNWLVEQLGTHVTHNIIIKEYNHMDLVLAKDAKVLAFPKIVEIITSNE